MLALLMFDQGLLYDAMALAAVALLGFIFGRRTRRYALPTGDVTLLIELGRAQCIAKELKHIVLRVESESSAQLCSVDAFQSQLSLMQQGAIESTWQNLRDQADALLGPTMKLSTTLSLACDELRQQQAQLNTYASTRIDPETGLHNRRSMGEHLEAMLSAHADGERRLALALFSIPAPADRESDEWDDRLKAMGKLLEQSVRANDICARYSQDEFIVLMPKTPLAGALVFAERLVRTAGAELDCAVWGGVVEASPGETPDKLLSRADSALYSARTHEESCLFQHNGLTARRHAFDPKAEAAEPNLLALQS
jgi:diguanylate cyclase (GGDEF)-like protein